MINSDIDKIQLNYKSDGDKVIEIKANDSNFNNIIELSSNIKLKSKSNKKHLSGDIIIVKFYSKDDMKLMLQLIDGHIFVNAYQYKYSDYSKDSASTLEKILTLYFNIK